MASSLNPLNLAGPGVLGLNTQDSLVGMDPRFCVEAHNAVFDKEGRLAARKGWERFVAADSTINTNGVTLVHEYINSVGESELILAVPGGNVYAVDSSSTANLIYSAVDWSAPYWKAVNFNNKCYLFQRGHDPLVYDGSSCVKVKNHGSYTGTVQQANEVLAAFGRLWTADTLTDKVTIKWSDTLIGEAWTGGAAGSIDLNTVYSDGVRPITALAAFNGKLVIFCDKTIILYGGAETDPATNLTLSDIIDGIGCIARDTVIDIGTDILFLSDSGVRSLGRVIQEKSAPINDISRNVRDTMMEDVQANYAVNSSYDGIVSGYNELDGFYLLSLPAINKAYCLDLKARNQDSSARVTTWGLAPQSMTYRINRDFVYGLPTGVGRSSTEYSDDFASYEFSYASANTEGKDNVNDNILKKFRLICYGGGGYTLRLLWGTNYNGFPNQKQLTIPNEGTIAEYNTAEYGLGEYSGTLYGLRTIRTNLSRSGQVFQIGLSVPINGKPFSIQDLTVYVKKGKLSL